MTTLTEIVRGIGWVVTTYTRNSVNYGRYIEQHKNFWWIRWNLWHIWELEQGILNE